MAAVIGLADERVQELCAQARAAGEVVVANYNSPGQVVVSGEPAALEKVTELVKAEKGRALPLRVSGAFHSPLMEEAAAEFAALVAGLAAARAGDAGGGKCDRGAGDHGGGARAVMSRQMTSPVYWTKSVQTMVERGVTSFLEGGPGQVLTKLIERIAPEAEARGRCPRRRSWIRLRR